MRFSAVSHSEFDRGVGQKLLEISFFSKRLNLTRTDPTIDFICWEYLIFQSHLSTSCGFNISAAVEWTSRKIQAFCILNETDKMHTLIKWDQNFKPERSCWWAAWGSRGRHGEGWRLHQHHCLLPHYCLLPHCHPSSYFI